MPEALKSTGKRNIPPQSGIILIDFPCFQIDNDAFQHACF